MIPTLVRLLVITSLTKSGANKTMASAVQQRAAGKAKAQDHGDDDPLAVLDERGAAEPLDDHGAWGEAGLGPGAKGQEPDPLLFVSRRLGCQQRADRSVVPMFRSLLFFPSSCPFEEQDRVIFSINEANETSNYVFRGLMLVMLVLVEVL